MFSVNDANQECCSLSVLNVLIYLDIRLAQYDNLIYGDIYAEV